MKGDLVHFDVLIEELPEEQEEQEEQEEPEQPQQNQAENEHAHQD